MDEKKIRREVIQWRVVGSLCAVIALGLFFIGCYVLTESWSSPEPNRLRTWMIVGGFWITSLCLLCLAVLARVAQRQEEYALYFMALIDGRDVERPREDVVEP